MRSFVSVLALVVAVAALAAVLITSRGRPEEAVGEGGVSLQDIARIEQKLDRMETGIREMSARLDGFDSKLTGLEEDVSAVLRIPSQREIEERVVEAVNRELLERRPTAGKQRSAGREFVRGTKEGREGRREDEREREFTQMVTGVRRSGRFNQKSSKEVDLLLRSLRTELNSLLARRRKRELDDQKFKDLAGKMRAKYEEQVLKLAGKEGFDRIREWIESQPEGSYPRRFFAR